MTELKPGTYNKMPHRNKLAFDDVFDASPDANLLVDAAGRVIAANERTADVFGYPRAGLIGQPVEVLIAERCKLTYNQMRQQSGRSQRNRGLNPCVELTGLRADGSEFPMQILLCPIHDTGGSISLHVMRDLTVQKSAELALQKSEALFRSIFDNSAIGIELIDLHGRIMESNQALQDILGYSIEELRQRPFIELTDLADISSSQRQFQALLKGECNDYTFEKHYLRKDGKPIWVMLNVSAVHDETGKMLYAIAMVEDIHHRKEVEAELAEVQRRLLDSTERERLSLAQELHDGPIQDLYGAIFQLQELVVEEHGRATQSVVLSSLATIQQAISTLRYTIGELRPPTLAPFGLEKAIRSHAERFHEQHPEIEVRLDLTNDGQSLPESTRLTLFRIYQQLMSNVFRHAQAEQVRVCFLMSPTEIQLEVADNGRGFEIPRRWLDLARQGHLGLVGAKERAETLGGKLEIVSRPDLGARVTAIIPR
jgi:PAS domain S-box-containing protein